LSFVEANGSIEQLFGQLLIATEAKSCYHFHKLRLYKCTENCAWIMKENIVKTSQNSANSPEYWRKKKHMYWMSWFTVLRLYQISRYIFGNCRCSKATNQCFSVFQLDRYNFAFAVLGNSVVAESRRRRVPVTWCQLLLCSLTQSLTQSLKGHGIKARLGSSN